jgi:hypothetical protein
MKRREEKRREEKRREEKRVTVLAVRISLSLHQGLSSNRLIRIRRILLPSTHLHLPIPNPSAGTARYDTSMRGSLLVVTIVMSNF